jgi:serine/threonine protein kinase
MTRTVMLSPRAVSTVARGNRAMLYPRLPLPPGTLLRGGDYRLQDCLGAGGFGITYRAEDLHLQRTVAIKEFFPAACGRHGLTVLPDPQKWQAPDFATARDRFREEGQRLASVLHPGVPQVYAVFAEHGTAYLVMQFIEGRSVEAYAGAGRGLAWEEAVEIVHQAGEALSAVHAADLLHRDVKPENLVRRPDGRIVLVDFGAAREYDASGPEQSYTALRSPGYAPLEQYSRRRGQGPYTDVYALAATLYRLLTGVVPVDAVQRWDGEQLAAAGVRDEVPEWLSAAVAQGMALESADRPQTVEAFLELFSSHQSVRITDVPGNVSGGSEAERRAILDSERGPQDAGGGRLALLHALDVEPDATLLAFLEGELRNRRYTVFTDHGGDTGVEWAREIGRQILSADAVIPLLSAASAASEMLAYQIHLAVEAAAGQDLPRLLPVRVGYEGPLPDSLAAVLNSVPFILWASPDENDRVLSDLLSGLGDLASDKRSPVRDDPGLTPVLRAAETDWVVDGEVPQPNTGAGMSLAPLPLEAYGAVPLDSPFYVERETDRLFHQAIAQRESLVLVKGARQVGKTSLVARGLQRAREAGNRTLLTDFQKLNAADLESADAFFRTLAGWVADQLDLYVLPESTWVASRSPSINFERYVRRQALEPFPQPLVWGLDEVDRLFRCDFAGDVFGLFRSWHNERSLNPARPWSRLTLAIAYATEAHLFITDVNQSPFNVGVRLALEDFTVGQVEELNDRHGRPLSHGSDVTRFHLLVGGHPYLVRRGLHAMAAGSLSLRDLEADAERDHGIFGDHLRRLLVSVSHDAELSEALKGVLLQRPTLSYQTFYRLRSAGVVRGDNPAEARPRCGLYAAYLERHLLV